MNKAEQARSYLERNSFRTLCPKAVLFDMDGVLYDSMPNHVVAWRQSMAQFGIEMTEYDAYATEGARGIDTIRKMVKEQQKRNITLMEAQEMYDVKSRLFHQMPEPPIMPGIPELMEKMCKCGLSINVVTGSGQRPLIQRLLRDFSGFLDEKHITTAYDVRRGKPHPAPYLKGLKKAGNLSPWQALVIENAPLGIQAGAAARIFTIGVKTGPLPMSVLREAGADTVFRSMTVLNHGWEKFYQMITSRPIDERWMDMYEQIMSFMDTYKKCPSKHHAQDIKMVNWMKHNRKMRNRGNLSGKRLELFNKLLEKGQQYRRVNQYGYLNLP